MDIKNSIMHYIAVYSGSEKRIIENVTNDHLSDFRKKTDAENAITNNLNWLVKNGYIAAIELQNMTADERSYFDSDMCTIYRIIRQYNEIEYYEERRKQAEAENNLSISDRFELYLHKIEQNTNSKYWYAKPAYKCEIDNKTITIIHDDESAPSVIELEYVAQPFYDENENSLYYQYKGKSYIMQFVYLSGKIYVNIFSR